MGRRSVNSTKSGKFMNPTDQARKEARKKELKKNKKQRFLVRTAVLKGKDPLKLLDEMEDIDKTEFDPMDAPTLSEKVLSDKRRKLMETFQRVTRLYEREDPSYALELKKGLHEYQIKYGKLKTFYEQVKEAERVKVNEIPLPDLPIDSTETSMIPLPDPHFGDDRPLHGILKKSHQHDVVKEKRAPPGPPPGPPPALSDDEEDLYDTDEGKGRKKGRIRFAEGTDILDKDTRLKISSNVSSLQAKMLEIAGQAHDEQEGVIAESQDVNVESVLPSGDETPTEALLASMPAGSVLYRPPPLRGMAATGAPQRSLPPGHPLGRPPGVPPGPPPGLPPNIRAPPHRLPHGPPGMSLRAMRPPMVPPGLRSMGLPPQLMNPNAATLSAPPSIMKASHQTDEEKSGITIEAKPQIKNPIGDVTRFMPTSMRVKRDNRGKITKPVQEKRIVLHGRPAVKASPAVNVKTKDDAYDAFMKEMESLM